MKRLVVKVGTSTLTTAEGSLDPSLVGRLARSIAAVRDGGVQVALVTSGAVAAGASRLLIARPRTIPGKQAAAAVGQGLLMGMYAAAFDRCDLAAAQILLTRHDVADRTRYTNARNTLETLFRFGAIPVVNENDTIAVEELRFGDNDTLAAIVALLTDADLAVLLSDVDGLYDPADPDRQTIPVVSEVSAAIEGLARPASSGTGTGGMVTKLRAARTLTRAGIPMLIASGAHPERLSAAWSRWEQCSRGEGDPGMPGTLFLPGPRRLRGRKRWIAFGTRASGTLMVNENAREALVAGGKSLLAAGVTDASGHFGAGDLVRILDPEGREVARGLSHYSAEEIRQIAGRRSDEITGILGPDALPEVVHRDDLVVGL